MTLSQLQGRIRDVLCGEFISPLWVTAEISELKVNSRSGHCYLQLVEKGGRNGVPQAQAAAVIWAGQYGMLSSYFKGATGEDIKAGMKVLLSVIVSYHELYGMSLRIVDIDPLYTLGDLEQQRLLTIAQLREDGVFDLNREMGLPGVVQRIAVISSPQAAGYQDFIKELNAYAYSFRVELFGAVMQGHGAEQSIIEALGSVADRAGDFDAVVIIRGGGSQSDLSFLNSYMLGFHISQFPLPVIAGLGHDKDQSVADMVAALSLKTPTAVAAYLVERVAGFDARLEMLGGEIRNLAERTLVQGSRSVHIFATMMKERVTAAQLQVQWRLKSYVDGISMGARRVLAAHGTILDDAAVSLADGASRALANESVRVGQTARLLAAADPKAILARGFAIVRAGERTLTSPGDVNQGDILDITLYKGLIKAKVTENGE